MNIKLLRILFIVIATPFVFSACAPVGASTEAKGEVTFSPYVDGEGNITLPNDFRLHLQHIGAWFVPKGGASGFHDVFTEASTIEYYRKYKKFPDGATLVKELRADNTGNYTTGDNVKYSDAGIKQWFVMIKDTKGRFPNHTSWGNGWGWALFKPDTDLKSVSKNYQADCLGCHIPAKDNDWVYTEAYPVLHTR